MSASNTTKTHAVLIAQLFLISSFLGAQSVQNRSLLDKARQAYLSAQALESELNEKKEAERSREQYLKVIRAYQRVYLITPHTGYADDALMSIAHLYEAIHDYEDATRTLTFLIREYPGTPFKDTAEKDLNRLRGVPLQKTIAVDNIRYWEAQNSVRVVVDLGGEIHFNQGEAKGPDRVFIDIFPARLNTALNGKQWPVKSGLLQQIRVGQYEPSTVRVVLDVGTVGHVTSFTLRDPDRLIIDILSKEVVVDASPSGRGRPDSRQADGPSEGLPATAAPAKPASAMKTPDKSADAGPSPAASQRPLPEGEAKPITPAKPPNAGPRSLVRSLGLKLSRVVIDAGHGGYDTGSIGPAGYPEKELVLDVAERLRGLVHMELGAEVVMTRSDDSFVSLESRTAIANQQEADLFISIHANSSQMRAARGVETYFLNFTSSREALETASRENAASERSIHELQDLVKRIILRDKLDESRELARHIQHSMAARKGAGADRGVKQAPFVVLIGANMPSILAEICFISNPQEEKVVKTAANRQAIAEALFEGVRSYAESLSGTKTAGTQDKIN